MYPPGNSLEGAGLEMMEREVILTVEGQKKLEEELMHLKTVKRREVAERIKQAREFGDINENSEYDHAKNEQAFIEGRILTIEKILRNARLMDGAAQDHGRVSFGCRVKVRDLDSMGETEFTIVGSTEADPALNKISNESPVGRALLNHIPGDVVEVKVPMGLSRYEIVTVKGPREGREAAH
jgi:transcription elongation factor GreA